MASAEILLAVEEGEDNIYVQYIRGICAYNNNIFYSSVYPLYTGSVVLNKLYFPF